MAGPKGTSPELGEGAVNRPGNMDKADHASLSMVDNKILVNASLSSLEGIHWLIGMLQTTAGGVVKSEQLDPEPDTGDNGGEPSS